MKRIKTYKLFESSNMNEIKEVVNDLLLDISDDDIKVTIDFLEFIESENDIFVIKIINNEKGIDIPKYISNIESVDNYLKSEGFKRHFFAYELTFIEDEGIFQKSKKRSAGPFDDIKYLMRIANRQTSDDTIKLVKINLSYK